MLKLMLMALGFYGGILKPSVVPARPVCLKSEGFSAASSSSRINVNIICISLAYLYFAVFPVFAVITKIDELLEDQREKHLNSIMKDLAAKLGLCGVEERIHPTSLYCSKVTHKMKRSDAVDEVMTELWDQVLRPEFYSQENMKKKAKSTWHM